MTEEELRIRNYWTGKSEAAWTRFRNSPEYQKALELKEHVDGGGLALAYVAGFIAGHADGVNI